MRKRATAYAVSVAALGVVLGLGCIVHSVYMWPADHFWEELISFFLFGILFVLCRSFPLILDENTAIDMSFICIFAAVLVKGPIEAAALTLFTLPLMFETGHSHKGIRVLYIWHTHPIKSLFNTGNQIIAILLAGGVYHLLGGQAGQIGLPGILLPAMAFIVLVIFLNGGILMTLFALDGQVSSWFVSLGQLLSQFWPNIAASAPIGFFIAYMSMQTGGEYLALLFMLPLLLARYAFKMYIDSKQRYIKLISTLSAAIEARDEYTQGHSSRVGEYAEKIAIAMYLPPKRVEDVRVAAMLHDIGKIGIDDAILRKPGFLDSDERRTIETHPEIGLRIIERNEFNDVVKDIILHHHERYDGKGYPHGIGGNEVMMEAYILAVADTHDAITSDRPYRKGRAAEVSVEIIKEESGKQFHPKVVDAFLSVMQKELAAKEK